MLLAPASQAPVAGASLSNEPWKIKHRIVYTLCRQFQEKSYKTSDKIYITS